VKKVKSKILESVDEVSKVLIELALEHIQLDKQYVEIEYRTNDPIHRVQNLMSSRIVLVPGNGTILILNYFDRIEYDNDSGKLYLDFNQKALTALIGLKNNRKQNNREKEEGLKCII
jgi:hypothetical protein